MDEGEAADGDGDGDGEWMNVPRGVATRTQVLKRQAVRHGSLHAQARGSSLQPLVFNNSMLWALCVTGPCEHVLCWLCIFITV